ncbi:SMAD/FHA domain-containing protein [Lipomyces kononenkoae]|uniref:SMAD/FHA domain-containing protein n=1 Tax=Lipomyces kononenkoae TaxID=34357 RepID=A0ACC3T588_LIPKO
MRTMDHDLKLNRGGSSSHREGGRRDRERDRNGQLTSARAGHEPQDRRDIKTEREHRHRSQPSHHHHLSRSERSERDRGEDGGYRQPPVSRRGEIREDEFVHESRRRFIERARDDRPARAPHSDRAGDKRYSERDSRRDQDRDRYDRSGHREDRSYGRSRGDIDGRSRGRSASPDRKMPPMRYEQINRTLGSSRGSRSPSRSPPPEKEMPNFERSGALMGDKLYKGVSLQYSEPAEARKPEKSYRFYVFKGGDIVDTLTLDQQPTYLFGRDRTVADVPLDHPSCSKQHAVLQYRLVVEEGGMFGEPVDRIAPFIYDLGSANGTQLNGERVPVREYVEVKEKDMLTFGLSSREYLLLTDEAAKGM